MVLEGPIPELVIVNINMLAAMMQESQVRPRRLPMCPAEKRPVIVPANTHALIAMLRI